jgi:hypothetical protein
VNQLFGLVRRHFFHPLATAEQITFPTGDDRYDAAALATFVDIRFFSHDASPLNGLIHSTSASSGKCDWGL